MFVKVRVDISQGKEKTESGDSEFAGYVIQEAIPLRRATVYDFRAEY